MLANSGTPLMWFELFHLTLANVLLGVVEGATLAMAWRARWVRSVAMMEAANFASSWAGFFLLALVGRADMTIESVRAWLLVGLGAAFVLTLIVELPFVRWVNAPGAATWGKAARATLFVHLFTYPLMVVLGWSASNLTLLTGWTVVPAAKLAQPGTHVVFFVDVDGRRVWRRDLVGGGERLLAELPRDFVLRGLELQSSADGTSGLRAAGYMSTGEDRNEDQVVPVCTDLTGLAVPTPAPKEGDGVPSLDPASPWQLVDGYWSFHCHGPTGTRELALETPIAWWTVRGATQIAGDLVLVTLSDQVCLLKASTGEIALLTRGRDATVAAVRR